ALVLSELASAGFTGIGLAVGASACNVAVVHRGTQIACERVARGGTWIDREVARITKISRRDAMGEQVLDLEGARPRKESSDVLAPTGEDGPVVADLYRNLIADLLNVLSDLLQSRAEIPLLPQPLPIVCGGGPAQIAGFGEMLTSALNSQKFPVA